jgi:cob(I)alamin adenosyltransferase
MLGQAQPDLTAALANINRSSENLASLTARIDEMLQQNQGDLGRFVQEGLGEAPALLRESRAALRDLEKLVAELQRDPSQLIHRAPSDALEMDP